MRSGVWCCWWSPTANSCTATETDTTATNTPGNHSYRRHFTKMSRYEYQSLTSDSDSWNAFPRETVAESAELSNSSSAVVVLLIIMRLGHRSQAYYYYFTPAIKSGICSFISFKGGISSRKIKWGREYNKKRGVFKNNGPKGPSPLFESPYLCEYVSTLTLQAV